MNKITAYGSAYSPINIPNFTGAGTPKILYRHELEKVSSESLNISITVNLELREVGGQMRIFKIMNGTSKFNIEINEILTISDLSKMWVESANNLVNTFKIFQVQKKLHPIMDINHSGEKELDSDNYLTNIVTWFYSI